MGINNLRAFMIEWNNTFIHDKAFRNKHKIAFNSPEHRNTCQIDIYLEHLEDSIFNEHADLMIESKDKESRYKKGIWLNEQVFNEGDLSDVFDKIVID